MNDESAVCSVHILPMPWYHSVEVENRFCHYLSCVDEKRSGKLIYSTFRVRLNESIAQIPARTPQDTGHTSNAKYSHRFSTIVCYFWTAGCWAIFLLIAADDTISGDVDEF